MLDSFNPIRCNIFSFEKRTLIYNPQSFSKTAQITNKTEGPLVQLLAMLNSEFE